MVLQDVHVAAPVALERVAGERVGYAPDVDVVYRSEEPRRVEEEALDAVVAYREELRVLSARGLVEHRVEDHLAAVDARARQPLHLAVELGRDAGDEVLLLCVRLVRPARERLAHLVAPLEVRRSLLAQVARQRHAPRKRYLAARLAKRRVVELVGLEVLERAAHLDGRRRREEVYLGAPEPVALVEPRHDLDDLAAEGVCGKPLHLGEAARRKEARTRRVVVVVYRQVLDGDARLRDQVGHVVLRDRLARHAPVLAALAQGGAHLRGVRVEEAYDALRHHLLQLLVGAEGEVHAVRVRADEDELVGEDEVDRLGDLGILLGRRERLLLRKLVQPHYALHGMHALLCHKPGRAEKHGADAAQEPAVGVLREYSVSYYLHGAYYTKSGPDRSDGEILV